MGAAVGERRHGHGLVPDIVKQIGDSKTQAGACTRPLLSST